MAKAFMATVFLIILLLLYHPPPIERLKHLKDVLLVHREHSSSTPPGKNHPTDYTAITRHILSEHRFFLATQIDRDYTHVEHLQRSFLGITSDATIILTYSVTYAVGFDLQPDRFTVTGNQDHITITLAMPQLVAPPSINLLHHTIPSTSFIINERTAVIALQQRLPEVTLIRAANIVTDPAVIALAERALVSFLTDVLERYPAIERVPVITIAYE